MAENNDIVSALNAGSGINIKELAQALVDAEKVPREALVQSKIAKSDAKISGLGIVKNVLERFKTAFQKLDSVSDFKTFSVSNSNTSAINISSSALANPGSHSIEVQSLALASRQRSTGFSATKAEINGGEPFAVQVTTREKQQFLSSTHFIVFRRARQSTGAHHDDICDRLLRVRRVARYSGRTSHNTAREVILID